MKVTEKMWYGLVVCLVKALGLSEHEIFRLESLPEKETGLISFLWIDASLKDEKFDPVYEFWRLVKDKRFTPQAHVVFTGVKPAPCWRDLTMLYSGMLFGTVYLLKYDDVTTPTVVPSQRGLFFR